MTVSPVTLHGIVFDCDGVMVDSRAANMIFYNRVLHHFGLPPLTPEQEAYAFMATARQALEYITPLEVHPQLERVCRDVVNYNRDIFPLLKLMPHFVEFLQTMRAYGLRLGINTNRRGDGMHRILEGFSLLEYFDPVITADIAQPKPAPDGLECILRQWNCTGQAILFVGDSLHDQHAATAAGVCFAAFGNPDLHGDIMAKDYPDLAAQVSQGFSLPRRK